jgi:hypothetical protein
LKQAKSFAAKLDITVYPTHIIVDGSGKIIKMLTGASESTPRSIESSIDELLDKHGNN